MELDDDGLVVAAHGIRLRVPLSSQSWGDSSQIGRRVTLVGGLRQSVGWVCQGCCRAEDVLFFPRVFLSRYPQTVCRSFKSRARRPSFDLKTANPVGVVRTHSCSL